MKMKIGGFTLLFLPFLAQSSEKIYLFDFAASPVTGKVYRSLIQQQHLPKWVNVGGTSAPATEIELNGVKYLALSGCKPHNCPTQAIAVLYSPVNGDIHGVYSEYNADSNKQMLSWLNVDPLGSDKMKQILLAILSGENE